LNDTLNDAIEDALEKAVEQAIEQVKDEEELLLECDQIPSEIAPGEHQSSGMAPLEKSLDDWEDVLNDAFNGAIEDALEKTVEQAFESAIEQVKDEAERLLECDQILSDIAAGKHQSSGMVPFEKSLDDSENVLNDMLNDGLDDAFEKLLEDALEQVKDEQNCSLECYHDQISSDIVPAKDLSSDLVPLEHYGAFGAGPGSWAMPRAERQEPKCDNLGMALLEHYGVFDAAPGAWDFSQCES